jgi:hypothetical protein
MNAQKLKFKQLCNKVFHDLYSLHDIARRIRWKRHMALLE